MEELELRQQNLIKELEEMQKQIVVMNKELNTCSKPAQPLSKNNVSTQTSIKHQPIDVNIFQNLFKYFITYLNISG